MHGHVRSRSARKKTCGIEIKQVSRTTIKEQVRKQVAEMKLLKQRLDGKPTDALPATDEAAQTAKNNKN